MTTRIEEKRFAARPVVEAYVEKVLRGALGWGDARVRITIPSEGTRSLIYFVAPDGGSPVAVQAFEDGGEHTRLRKALALGRKQELPIPDLVRSGVAALDRSRFGYCFIVMGFIDGKALPPEPPHHAVRESLAVALARLHGVKRRRWGKPGRMHLRSIREDLWASVGKRLADLGDGGSGAPGLDAEKVAAVEKWFAQTLASIDEPKQFRLCHHHLAPDDIILEPGGAVRFVDCGSLQFSRAARDLAVMRNSLFFDDDAAWDDFIHRYFEHFDEAFRKDCLKEIPLFNALYRLGKVRRKIYAGPEGEVAIARLLQATGLD